MTMKSMEKEQVEEIEDEDDNEDETSGEGIMGRNEEQDSDMEEYRGGREIKREAKAEEG